MSERERERMLGKRQLVGINSELSEMYVCYALSLTACTCRQKYRGNQSMLEAVIPSTEFPMIKGRLNVIFNLDIASPFLIISKR